MRNLIVALLALFVFTGVSAQQAKLSGLLIEFETAVKWEAVDAQWKARRTEWINEAKTAKTPLVLGKLLAEFETYVTWAAVDKRWGSARDRWIGACTSAASYSAVAKLMVEFESYTKWEGRNRSLEKEARWMGEGSHFDLTLAKQADIKKIATCRRDFCLMVSHKSIAVHHRLHRLHCFLYAWQNCLD